MKQPIHYIHSLPTFEDGKFPTLVKCNPIIIGKRRTMNSHWFTLRCVPIFFFLFFSSSHLSITTSFFLFLSNLRHNLENAWVRMQEAFGDFSEAETCISAFSLIKDLGTEVGENCAHLHSVPILIDKEVLCSYSRHIPLRPFRLNQLPQLSYG